MQIKWDEDIPLDERENLQGLLDGMGLIFSDTCNISVNAIKDPLTKQNTSYNFGLSISLQLNLPRLELIAHPQENKAVIGSNIATQLFYNFQRYAATLVKPRNNN